jgi:hypothetical protein
MKDLVDRHGKVSLADGLGKHGKYVDKLRLLPDGII